MSPKEQQLEYRTVSYLVSALANICEAPPNRIVDALTGLLWDEEEAGQIKVANMPSASSPVYEEAKAPSLEAAYEMGAKGGQAEDAERHAFEAWMRGHCWALCAIWTGTHYRGENETLGQIDPHAMRTRELWAAWRDRAALLADTPPR